MTHHITKLLAVPVARAYGLEEFAGLPPHAAPGPRDRRDPAEGVTVGLVLADGQHPLACAWGDCVGAAAFRPADALRVLRQAITPLVEGRAVTGFRALAEEVDAALREAEAPGANGASLTRREAIASPWRVLTTALGVEVEDVTGEARRAEMAARYGVGQALLGAAALVQGVTMAEVIAGEWGLALPSRPAPVHAPVRAGDCAGIDEALARRGGLLMLDGCGPGTKLVELVRELRTRVLAAAGEDYRPAIHLEVRGTLGRVSGNQPGRVLGRLYALEKAAAPCPLRVADPVIAESREAQVDLMRRLREYVRARGLAVELVASAWANTLEDIEAFVQGGAADLIHLQMPALGSVHRAVDAALLCRAHGVGVLLSGGSAGADAAVRVAAHIALATGAALVTAGPTTPAHREMSATLARVANRAS